MKDCNDKELEVGQAVIVYCMTGLRRGTVARLRTATRYGTEMELAQIIYDVPEEVYRHQVRYLEELDQYGYRQYAMDENGRYIYDKVLKKTNRHKEFYQSEKIYILDNSAE
jgi:hypothetical protein